MSTKSPTEADILRPIQNVSKLYFIMFAVAGLALGAFLVAWGYQLYQGLVVTGPSHGWPNC